MFKGIIVGDKRERQKIRQGSYPKLNATGRPMIKPTAIMIATMVSTVYSPVSFDIMI